MAMRGSSCPGRGRGPGGTPRTICQRCRRRRSLALASAPPTSAPTFLPATQITAIIAKTDPAPAACASGLVGARRASIHEKEKHFEPIPEGFRMSAMRRRAIALPTSCSESMASRSRRPSILCCLTGAAETIRWQETSGFPDLTTVTPTTSNHCPVDSRRGVEHLLLRSAGHDHRQVFRHARLCVRTRER